jgi:hypothetical protein
MRHGDRIFQLFHSPEDGDAGSGGSAAPEWPDYQVPDGVGAGDQPNDRDVTAGPTSAGDPAAPGGEAQPPASNDGADDQQPQDGAPQGNQPGNLPQGRLEQEVARLRTQNATLERNFNQQAGLLRKLEAVFSPPTAKEDPKTVALRNRLFEVVPELKTLAQLAGRSGDIMGLLDRAPGLTAHEERHWDSVARSTMAKVHSEIAPFMLGDGGTAEKLSDDQKALLAERFQKWCLSDKTGARVTRYETGDAKVVEEFRDYYVALNYAPARRQAVVAAAGRAAAGAAAPRAGRADATATSVPKVDPTDDDAAHARGWQHVQNAFAGRR